VEKSIIILYMDDYSYDEIAEIIGISVSYVGVKINRIKKKLKELLKEMGYGLK
jgi:RNA polymerase sigma-70 factor (ECF subfamily)